MCALQLTKSTAGVSFRYTSPVGGRQSHVVGKANYGSSLYSELQGGCRRAHRYHVEPNENKPFEFVGEDVILPN